MENASRALLMAAGVLIGILILSLAVYLFVSFGSTSAEVHKRKAEEQIEQFNSQFTIYEGKDDVTIYDVITVANLATENNTYYEFTKRTNISDGKDNYITVKLGNNTIEKGYKYIGNLDYNELISQNINANGELTKFSCKTQISNITKKVFLVIFTEK